MSKINYSKILKTPMVFYRAATYLLKGKEACKEEVNRQLKEREKALYAHYGLEYEPLINGHTLALKLAQDHLPGFNFEDEKPETGLLSGIKGAEFYLRVKLYLLKHEGISDRQAINTVAIQTGIKAPLRTLTARYYGRASSPIALGPLCYRFAASFSAKKGIPLEELLELGIHSLNSET